jgi:uncharacterized small protein (DUF1192 family)
MNSNQKSTGEVLFDIFYSMLREGGLVLNQNSIERLQDESRRSGISLQKIIEKEAKVVVKRLQEAVSHGFKAAANDIAKLQAKVEKLEADSHPPVQRKDIAVLQKEIDVLKKEVKAAASSQRKHLDEC